jgi:hypothetical protein
VYRSREFFNGLVSKGKKTVVAYGAAGEMAVPTSLERSRNAATGSSQFLWTSSRQPRYVQKSRQAVQKKGTLARQSGACYGVIPTSEIAFNNNNNNNNNQSLSNE